MEFKKIPVTVITGFLGSGKTTLINRILTEDHGIRFAVIENEFGEIGIDQDLVLNEKEEIVEMNNGCICCTVRGDLIRIIKKLVTSEKPPDHILIETTGLADPSPVAQTFLTDPDIEKHTYLDAILTLVDAKHIEQQLSSTPEAKDQIAFADVILISKIDLVTKEELSTVENRILGINKFAKLLHSNKGTTIDLKDIFNVGGFDVKRALSINPKFLEIEYPFEWGGLYELQKGDYTITVSPHENEKRMKLLFAPVSPILRQEALSMLANPVAIIFSSPAHIIGDEFSIKIGNELNQLVVEKENTKFFFTVEEDGVFALFAEHTPDEFNLTILDNKKAQALPNITKEFRVAHSHDDGVNSVGIETFDELDPAAFMYFITSLVQNFGNELYRFKGILSVQGEDKQVVLQGVHMLYEMKPGKAWSLDEKRKSTIVFIGKNLDRNILTQGFLMCTHKQ